MPQHAGKDAPSQVVQKALEWEINMARGFLQSYEKLLTAHSFLLSIVATVNFIGFLQPPKGWNERDTTDVPTTDGAAAPPPWNSMNVMFDTGSIEAFSITNSLSLYCAISGLLFYIYCSSPALLSSFTPFELPPSDNNADNKPSADKNEPLPTDNNADKNARAFTKAIMDILHNVRACLRQVILPSIRRRAIILSGFLAASLTFSVMAFVSSGYAAASLHERWHYVVIPGIPGCILVFVCLVLALRKHFHDLDFDQHFNNYWKYIVKIDMPHVEEIDKKTCHKLDYSPFRIGCPSCLSFRSNRCTNKHLPDEYA